MTSGEVKELLGLVPHPREGGWYVRTYEAAEHVLLERYGAARRTGTAIYYLLERGTFSEMHRPSSDEVFHFYLGGRGGDAATGTGWDGASGDFRNGSRGRGSGRRWWSSAGCGRVPGSRRGCRRAKAGAAGVFGQSGF